MDKKTFELNMKALEEAKQRAMASPQAAREMLLKAGIITKSGRLAKPYR